VKLLIFVGMNVFGAIGWSLAESVGFGFLGAFIISGIGSIFGVYAGWWTANRLLN
jgi:hypothetical protein